MKTPRTEWLAKAGYGLGLHWTTQSMPQHGERLPYREAVYKFDMNLLRDQVVESGAGYLLFTISHAEQYFAFPSATLDAILPGRTHERDLYDEMYQALAPHNIPIIFYYPSVGTEEDMEWREASRFKTDPAYFASLQYDLVAEIGERYGNKVAGWWVDNCYDAATEYVGWKPGRGSRYDYGRYAQALRTGNLNRIVTFNFRGTSDWGSKTGIGFVDYAAGESNFLDRVPSGPLIGEAARVPDTTSMGTIPTSGTLLGEGESQWHSYVWMDDFWIHLAPGTPKPRYSDEHVIEYTKYVSRFGGVFTYGTAPFQDTLIAEPVMEQLRRLKTATPAKPSSTD